MQNPLSKTASFRQSAQYTQGAQERGPADSGGAALTILFGFSKAAGLTSPLLLLPPQLLPLDGEDGLEQAILILGV